MSTFPPPPPTPPGPHVEGPVFFTMEYLCSRAYLTVCNATSHTFTPAETACLPPTVTSGSLTLQEPSLLVMGVVTAMTAWFSAYRIAKHVKGGALEYATFYLILGLNLLFLVLLRTVAYEDSVPHTVVLSITIVLASLTWIFLFFAALSDAALLPAATAARVKVYVAVTLLESAALLVGIHAKYNPLLFAAYYAVPYSAFVGFVIVEAYQVYHLRAHRRRATLWLVGGVSFVVLALLASVVFSDYLCLAFTSNFDGTFFFYLLVDLASTALYRFLQQTKTGLDPDVLAMLRRHRDIARLSARLDDDQQL